MTLHKTRIAAFLMGMAATTLALPVHAAATSSPCLILRHMSGNSEIATVENRFEEGSYKTYLARNARRNSQGVLDSFIKFELVPARWGFDLQTANGLRFGQINREGGLWTVNTAYDLEKTCSAHRVTVRMDKGGVATVLDKGKPIGRIARFPAHEM